MIEVVITRQGANDIINIVYDLRDQGFVQGIDFEFAYYGAKVDDWSGDEAYNKYTVFRFANESVASWFRLKYDK